MRFAFIIPLVHPENSRVANYQTVETTLRVTLDCLVRQRADDSFVIVVCHVLPEWSHLYSERVRFVLINRNLDLPYGLRHVDKGVKYLAGLAYATDVLSAKYIMLMDGDDFAHVDLVRRVQRGMLAAPGQDGWIITAGYHALVSATPGHLVFKATYEVAHFNKNCGSCRIFHAEKLIRIAEKISPSFWKERGRISYDLVSMLPNDVVDCLLLDAPKIFRMSDPFIVFANHINQSILFDLREVNEPLMAKGCGHGNHAGIDGVYWYRVKRQVKLSKFLEDFGILGGPASLIQPIAFRPLSTKVKAIHSVMNEAVPSMMRRFKAYRAR